MRLGQSRLARLMVALCVALSLAVMPVLSQQAMAAHHATDAVEVKSQGSNVHAHKAVTDCEKQQPDTSDKRDMSCCDMSCSTVVAFDEAAAPLFTSSISEHREVGVDELYSRINFGLKRPPKA